MTHGRDYGLLLNFAGRVGAGWLLPSWTVLEDQSEKSKKFSIPRWSLPPLIFRRGHECSFNFLPALQSLKPKRSVNESARVCSSWSPKDGNLEVPRFWRPRRWGPRPTGRSAKTTSRTSDRLPKDSEIQATLWSRFHPAWTTWKSAHATEKSGMKCPFSDFWRPSPGQPCSWTNEPVGWSCRVCTTSYPWWWWWIPR